ncbi:MAG: phage integrase N-terminal SAM-like domain-containing protein, partial [Bacteroidales bacterium]|nr:phage integrase N-terminal SAM-like domain-containing protein [Bacteroidales bacterium]
MKQIPADLKTRYSSMLVNKGFPEKYHYDYEKWLRYYLDFCGKYGFNQLNKGILVNFIKKLKEKKQTDQQQKQAYHSISLFYELGSINSEQEGLFKNRNKKLSTKKDNLKLTNTNWTPVYDGLIAEIKLRHYSPKTLKSYGSWVRQFQNYTRSKDSGLLSSTDVKD